MSNDPQKHQDTLPNRPHFLTFDTIRHLWTLLDLPASALSFLSLGDFQDHSVLPSSFKISHLAHVTIALSALAASLLDFTRNPKSEALHKVTVPLHHAALEFASEQLYTLNSEPPPNTWGAIGGLHRTKDGYVRIHDSFPNHRAAALRVLGLPDDASRDDVAEKLLYWKSIDIESAAMADKAIIYALRPYSTWSSLPQCQLLPDSPITIRRLSAGPPRTLPSGDSSSCVHGLKVLEFSRVIAAPVAGRTLAAHGADVLWVTSPNLPALPGIDIDVSRGKRSVQLDLDVAEDLETVKKLIKDADVVIQSYRPGSLAQKGLNVDEIVSLCPEGIVIANLSAWGEHGPWKECRGFDSMVQTVSGLNVDEAEAFAAGGGDTASAKVLPVQALDHAAGYLLAAGILAALYRRAKEGGSWEVGVSLAATGKFLRSLGRDKKFGEEDVTRMAGEYLEERECGFGTLRAVRHAASVKGKTVGWERMPGELGKDEAVWL